MKSEHNYELPLVSIICICWNHEKYIAECLNSLIKQTYENIEIVVVDNNSTDNSSAIAKEILIKSSLKNSILERKENYGVSNNLNFALANCNGKYLIAISTDDWLTNNSVEKKVSYMIQNPQFALVYSNGYIYYENQNLIIPYQNKKAKEGKVYNQLLVSNFVFIIGAMLNVDELRKIGGYNESSPIEDWEMCIRIARNNEIGYIKEPLAYYRKHDNNISNQLNKMLENELIILSNYKSNFYAQLGKINAYLRYFKLSILKKFSSFTFYITLKKMYNKIN